MQNIQNVNPVRMINVKYVKSIELDDRIREIIKYHILQKKLSIRKVAQMLEGEISYSFLSYLMAGRNNVITVEKFKKILNVLDLDIEEVLGGSINFY